MICPIVDEGEKRTDFPYSDFQVVAYIEREIDVEGVMQKTFYWVVGRVSGDVFTCANEEGSEFIDKETFKKIVKKWEYLP